MLWNVHHWWSRGARFDFNYYRHSLIFLIVHPGEIDPEALLSRYGITQGYPISIVLYGLILYVLVEKIRGVVSRISPVVVC